MSDLTAWLLERIAEDEAVANRERGGEWVAPYDEPLRWSIAASGAPDMLVVDPARVLAECAAKRRIVELHARDSSGSVQWCATCVDWSDEASDSGWPCPTLRALASVYADAPGFREEWL